MKNENYKLEININTTPAEAFNCINRVSDWWATNVTGDPKNLNDFFTVRFGKTFATIKVIEVVPEEKIVWHVIDSLVPLFKNERQWIDTKLLWEISIKDNSTQVSFTHIGLTPETECYSDCVKGWSFYINESLFKLLTEHKGLPGTGIFANVAIAKRRYEGLLYFKNDPLPTYQDGHIFLDVKETMGEQVVSIYGADKFCKETFDVQKIIGEYFMIVENRPVYENSIPLEDILKLKNENL